MSDPFVASIRPERNSQNLGVQLEPLHGCAIDLPVHTGVIAVDSFGLSAVLISTFLTARSVLTVGLPRGPSAR